MSPTRFDRCCLLLGRAAVLLPVLVAPLLLAEGVVRLCYDPPALRRVYDPFAYRIPHPLLEEEFEGPEGDRVSIRLNELGMRGPSIAAPVKAGTVTLVFLGGSTTDNYAYPEEATFPVLIGERLEADLGRPVRVFNAGMSGATTSVSLARLQHHILDLDPTLVVVMHGINDLMSGFHPRFRPDGRHLDRPALPGTLPRSYLYDWLRRRPRHDAEGSRTPVSHFPSLAVFERNLRSMAGIAEANGVPILFLTQGHLFGERLDPPRVRCADLSAGVLPDSASLARGMESFNRSTHRLATSSRALTFDLDASVPPSAELFLDGCHLTRAGNRHVAAVLSPVLLELLQPPSSTPSG